jgi:hypothetical protein
VKVFGKPRDGVHHPTKLTSVKKRSDLPPGSAPRPQLDLTFENKQDEFPVVRSKSRIAAPATKVSHGHPSDAGNVRGTEILRSCRKKPEDIPYSLHGRGDGDPFDQIPVQPLRGIDRLL